MGRNLDSLLGGSMRDRASSADTSVAEPPLVEDAESDASSKPARRMPDLRAVRPAVDLAAVDSMADDSSVTGSVSAESMEPGAAPAEPIDIPGDAAGTVATASGPESAPGARSGDRLRTIGIDRINRGPFQPRRHFDQALLQELADSLGAQGLIQPILVRERDGAFELIAGERRWRAAQLAGMHEIPAIVRELEDKDVASVALIENIQRKDLNPLEEAAAFRRLCDDFGMTHQEVADSVGRSRVAVSNMMRLLELHDEVKLLVDRGELEMGNARALLGVPIAEQPTLAQRVVKQGLTTRATEKLVRGIREGRSAPTPVADIVDPDIDRLAVRLGDLLGAPVKIRHRPNGGGRLEISYSSVEELEGVLAHIR